jgi:hypothetical protein
MVINSSRAIQYYLAFLASHSCTATTIAAYLTASFCYAATTSVYVPELCNWLFIVAIAT